ncbi:hypothetical protein PHAVU_001G145700 [Phaseolus vulgaris]|uniref:Dirigent protein n=1 Tax=Phaseolus vulgaris TaxID=3885 RepID=V7CW05_PHAVU|nr:hypothetical protein PHAVU_001G145700g [Phaseolus vulgaris]ESW34357.1 hypothetical protein PHAVU_001G145700g [Phaseolus vulgaris]
MANSKTLMTTFLIPLTLTSFLFSLAIANFYHTISPMSLGYSEEKITHFHFYFHEVVTTQKPSLVIAMEPLKGKSKCPLPFGSLVVIEDPLTIGPNPESKLIGKAQGFYISSAQTEGLELELVMGMTLSFIEGEYNGSTLSVLGRNTIFSEVREMPIIGGTGAFRFARGYVLARSVSVDYLKGDATVEYNVYVYHYSSHHHNFNHGIQYTTDPILDKI